jgi:hypothetical protein
MPRFHPAGRRTVLRPLSSVLRKKCRSRHFFLAFPSSITHNQVFFETLIRARSPKITWSGGLRGRVHS